MWLSKYGFVVFWLTILLVIPFYLYHVISECVDVKRSFNSIGQQLEEQVCFHFVKEVCLPHIESLTKLAPKTIEA